MAERKTRLDIALVERGLAETRERAQRLIRAGLVHNASERLEKPGRMIPESMPLTVKGPDCPYVSRGGFKLAGALDLFALDVAGLVALDLGASTGGFTDCLLQRGARLVHAVDVGRGQLHNKLLGDPRVISRERTHMDDLHAGVLDPAPQFAVADLSFISLRRAFPVLTRVLVPGSHAVLLVKPQFEAGREHVPRSGVVTDSAVHDRVRRELREAAQASGLQVLGECESPITGGDGNREFFLWCALPAGGGGEVRNPPAP